MGNEDVTDILRMLEKEREKTEHHLARVNAAIAALVSGNNGVSHANHSTVGVVPPIQDIAHYLRDVGKPVHQAELIRAVGELRQKRYPSLSGHYSNVWRALEYHIRHERIICCVDPQTWEVVPLKALPDRPKARKLPNVAELYEQDNWFALQSAVEGRRMSAKERAFEIGQN